MFEVIVEQVNDTNEKTPTLGLSWLLLLFDGSYCVNYLSFCLC
jgi:hypothetical protein